MGWGDRAVNHTRSMNERKRFQDSPPHPDGSLRGDSLWIRPGDILERMLESADPAVDTRALACVQAIAALGLPVIAAGGIYTESQIQTMRAGGALAVQLDAVLWRGFEG